jgi:hypothetical protein
MDRYLFFTAKQCKPSYGRNNMIKNQFIEDDSDEEIELIIFELEMQAIEREKELMVNTEISTELPF